MNPRVEMNGGRLGGNVHVDLIEPVLNPVQRADLSQIMDLTPPRRRVGVALAYLDWTLTDWAEASGMAVAEISRWVRGDHRMPYGAAIRLARVIGLDTDQLFVHFAR